MFERVEKGRKKDERQIVFGFECFAVFLCFMGGRRRGEFKNRYTGKREAMRKRVQ